MKNLNLINNNNQNTTNALILTNSNKLPVIPDNPQDIPNFVQEQLNFIILEKTWMNSNKSTLNEYKKVFKDAQLRAELVLDAELKLGKIFNSMQVNPGKKGDETKAEIIKKSYGFSKKQYIDIQKLTAESVKEAKELAKQKGKIVTRNDALKLLKLKHKVKNNTEFVHNTGIYETINLPTHNHERIANPINYCVLFANVGIGEYYLEENGFHAAVANEFLPERARWYKELHPKCNVIQGNITEKVDEIIDAYKKTGCKMLLASPPCQTFTVAGKRDFSDKRTYLFIPTLEIIEKTMPEYVVIENVKEFLTASPEDLKEFLEHKSIDSSRNCWKCKD